MNATPVNTRADDQHPPSPIRLSIAHVLLWTATTGLLLGLLRTALLHDFSIDGAAQPARDFKIFLFKVILAVFTPIDGAALAGLLLAVGRTMRVGPRFPVRPGHWLLIIVGGVVLVSIASLVLSEMRLVYGGSPALLLIHFLHWAVPIALCALAAMWMCRHNCYAWLPTTVGVAIPLIGHFNLAAVMSATVLKVISAITSVSLVSAVITDMFKGTRQDFLHWTGVVVMGARLLLTVQYWFL